MRLFCVLTLTLTVLACESKTEPPAPAPAPTPAPASKPAPFEPKPVKLTDTSLTVLAPAVDNGAFTAQLDAVLIGYLTMKDALILHDADGSRAAAKAARASLDAVKPADLDEKATAAWTAHRAVIEPALDAIAADGSDLKTQRTHLAPLSEAIFAAARSFGAGKGKLNVQYCPMANANQGGYWLSAERDIKNPYYGDKMLACGEVRELL
jgi:Cu(I)/Ag(I) efflux system membrane fusion protein